MVYMLWGKLPNNSLVHAKEAEKPAPAHSLNLGASVVLSWCWRPAGFTEIPGMLEGQS